MTKAHDRIMARLASDPAIASLFESFAETGMRLAVAQAKADPHAHRLTRTFGTSGPRWRYWLAGHDGRGREVRFCWSTNRNVAGYFLTWREVISKTGGKRDQWAARKSRDACKEVAARRQNAWIDRANAEQERAA